MPAMSAQLLSRSREYYQRKREAQLSRFEAVSRPGPQREARMKELRDAFARIARWFDMDGISKTYILGREICYADLTIAAWLMPFKKILGESSEEWRAIRTWDGGRWERLMDAVVKYE